MASLHAVHVGTPQQLGTPGAADPFDRPWRSGFLKLPVAGPVAVGWNNLAGDGQADLVNHGGADKAVCVYSLDHYGFWRRELGFVPVPSGAFGENFTVADLDETGVCVGDTWAAGDALFQVSQPRQPCWKLARRWRVKDLAVRVRDNGRTGWYFRVVRPGTVAAGLPLTLSARPHPDWTVARANDVVYGRSPGAAELARLPELADSWKRYLDDRG